MIINVNWSKLKGSKFRVTLREVSGIDLRQPGGFAVTGKFLGSWDGASGIDHVVHNSNARFVMLTVSMPIDISGHSRPAFCAVFESSKTHGAADVVIIPEFLAPMPSATPSSAPAPAELRYSVLEGSKFCVFAVRDGMVGRDFSTHAIRNIWKSYAPNHSNLSPAHFNNPAYCAAFVLANEHDPAGGIIPFMDNSGPASKWNKAGAGDTGVELAAKDGQMKALIEETTEEVSQIDGDLWAYAPVIGGKNEISFMKIEDSPQSWWKPVLANLPDNFIFSNCIGGVLLIRRRIGKHSSKLFFMDALTVVVEKLQKLSSENLKHLVRLLRDQADTLRGIAGTYEMLATILETQLATNGDSDDV